MVPIPTLKPVAVARPSENLKSGINNLTKLIGAGQVLYEGVKAEQNRVKLLEDIKTRAPYIQIRGNENLQEIAKGLQQVNTVELLYNEAKAIGYNLPDQNSIYNYAFKSSPEAVANMTKSLRTLLDRAKATQEQDAATAEIGTATAGARTQEEANQNMLTKVKGSTLEAAGPVTQKLMSGVGIKTKDVLDAQTKVKRAENSLVVAKARLAQDQTFKNIMATLTAMKNNQNVQVQHGLLLKQADLLESEGNSMLENGDPGGQDKIDAAKSVRDLYQDTATNAQEYQSLTANLMDILEGKVGKKKPAAPKGAGAGNGTGAATGSGYGN